MKDITNYVDVEQAHAIMDAAAACSARLLTLKILWITGVRVDELRHIRPCDLEYATNMIHIVKAKGGKQRRVFAALDNALALS